jgi:outer membrane protein assembly factor BamB
MRENSKLKNLKLQIRYLFIILVLLLSHCGSAIHIEYAIRSREQDWLAFGGNAQHTNQSASVLTPPLKLAWEYDASGGFGPGSPLVIDSIVFVGTLNGELHAVNINTGSRIGYISTDGSIVGAPVIDEGRIIVAVALGDYTLAAFDLRYSSVLWRKNLGGIESSPLVVDDKLIVGTTNGKLHCIKKFGGDSVWQVNVKKPIHSSPASDGNIVVVGCDDGVLYAVNVKTGKEAWQFKTGASIFASPAIQNGRVLCGSHDGFFYCLNLADGTVQWKSQLGSKIYATPAFLDSLVFIGATNGMLSAFNVNDGTLKWKFQAGSVINSSAIVSGDKLFFGSLDRYIYSLSARTGEVLWKHQMEGRIKTSPVVWGSHLIIAAEEKYLYAFTPE